MMVAKWVIFQTVRKTIRVGVPWRFKWVLGLEMFGFSVLGTKGVWISPKNGFVLGVWCKFLMVLKLRGLMLKTFGFQVWPLVKVISMIDESSWSEMK